MRAGWSPLDRSLHRVTLPALAAIVLVAVAAEPGTLSGSSAEQSIVAATYKRLADSTHGPTIGGASPVLQMPRGYTYRVTVVGNSIDLVQTIVPGNPAVLRISNVRRRNGLETGSHGELLFDVNVSPRSIAYQRIPVNFLYVTGQRDRMFIEVHPGCRVSAMTPNGVQADEPPSRPVRPC